jgi:hypothetical protein
MLASTVIGSDSIIERDFAEVTLLSKLCVLELSCRVRRAVVSGFGCEGQSPLELRIHRLDSEADGFRGAT